MASGTRQAEMWGPSAELWVANHETYALDIADWLFDRLDLSADTHLLDAGCGAGGSVLKARSRGTKVTGTDVATEMLDICRRRVPDSEFMLADSESLPFADNTFDSVLALHSLQFTENPVRALHEFQRVSKPRAKIGIAMFGDMAHADFAVLGAAVRKLFVNPPSFEGPFSLSPPTKLHGVIKSAGLEILESEDFDRTREFESFNEFWHTQSGTGTTRYSIAELGEQPVRDAMAVAIAQFTDANGRISLKNRFHAVICRKST